jgi:ABC-type transport system involved in cytochrome c biogenesis permease subunit
VGRGPWGNLYEFSVAFAIGVLGGYLFLSRRYAIRAIGFIPTGVALFLLGYAFTLPQEIGPLVPALDNPPLITLHVAMAMLSYGIFAVSFAAAIGYLIQGKENRVSWLPPAAVLDEVAHRAVIIGFPIFATLIILARTGRRSPGALLGLGPQGDVGPGHVADLRRVPARPNSARSGPAGRPR